MTYSCKIEESGAIKILVVCADWCSVCRDYRATLNDFPEFDINEWQEISREDHNPDEKNKYNYLFLNIQLTLKNK